ncbi:hypothetical protein P7L74_21790 [Tistrella mobilis]|uniref:hypothetical protein n=1 Tax=Tistrella mobilis TaxID=171437 RepID=UPI003555C085
MHKALRRAVVIGLAAAMPAGAAALAWTPPQGFATAAHAWETGDYAAARSLFGRLAEAGDARAGFYLGVMAEQGQGQDADPAGAAVWYGRAAEAGDARAAFNLARLLDQGAAPALPADPARAARLYEQAARAGIVAADTGLALMQLDGRAAGGDEAAARARLLRAARAGDGAADHALALRALAGDPPDMVEAVARCRRAVARGYSPAGALLDQLSAAADPDLLAAAAAREPVLDAQGK